MADIVHKLPMHASIGEVWSALEWSGLPSPAKDGIVRLRLDEARVAVLRLVDVEPGARAAWQCVDGPPDWVGTDVSIDLAPDGDDTIVRLRHRNWREADDGMGQWSTRWAWLLFGLKSRVEIPEAEDLWT
jgi:hypothetical protein